MGNFRESSWADDRFSGIYLDKAAIYIQERRKLLLLHGSGSGVGDALITNPGTVGVTFVGSSKVGEYVYKTAINHVKRAQCQGGAKNHVLIAEDAVIDEIMQNVVDSCFGHVGERCFAVSNVLAVEKIYDKVKEKFIELSKKLVLGYGMDKGVTLGPVFQEMPWIRS